MSSIEIIFILLILAIIIDRKIKSIVRKKGAIKLNIIKSGWGRLNLLAALTMSIIVGVNLESNRFDYDCPFGTTYNGYPSSPDSGVMLTGGIIITLLFWIFATILFTWVVKGKLHSGREFKRRLLVLCSIIAGSILGYFYCLWMEDGPMFIIFMIGFGLSQIAFKILYYIFNWVYAGFNE